MPSDLVAAVGAVITDGSGRLLLIRRGHDPGAGLWSLPGGRLELGEDDATALRREIFEETTLTVEVGALVGEVVRGPFVIRDYHCRVLSGMPAAASDASDIGWFTVDEVTRLPLVAELLVTLQEWGVL